MPPKPVEKTTISQDIIKTFMFYLEAWRFPLTDLIQNYFLFSLLKKFVFLDLTNLAKENMLNEVKKKKRNIKS